MQEASARTYQGIYLPFGRLYAPSLLPVCFRLAVTRSAWRGAPRERIRIAGVVRVHVAVVVHVAEVRGRGRIRRSKPPVHRRTPTEIFSI
nr:MAG TPA: hypothetical protein [Caudoviricetes sp.]